MTAINGGCPGEGAAVEASALYKALKFLLDVEERRQNNGYTRCTALVTVDVG